jgi:hypothetical protein
MIKTLVTILCLTSMAQAAYDIEPYRGKSKEELEALLDKHMIYPFTDPRQLDETIKGEDGYHINFPLTDGGDYVKEAMLTAEVDPHFKIYCDVYQTLMVRDKKEERAFDGIYTRKLEALYSVDCDIDAQVKDRNPRRYHPNPTAALLYYWKQAAWVQPDDAYVLSNALMFGFDNKIQINPYHAIFWAKRAKLLRDSAKHFYIPHDVLLPNTSWAKARLYMFRRLLLKRA